MIPSATREGKVFRLWGDAQRGEGCLGAIQGQARIGTASVFACHEKNDNRQKCHSFFGPEINFIFIGKMALIREKM